MSAAFAVDARGRRSKPLMEGDTFAVSERVVRRRIFHSQRSNADHLEGLAICGGTGTELGELTRFSLRFRLSWTTHRGIISAALPRTLNDRQHRCVD